MPGGNAPQAGPSRGVRNRRKGNGGGNIPLNGEVTLSRSEALQSVSMPASRSDITGVVALVPESFGFLKSLWHSFDRLKWLQLKVWWVPAVGTTYGGLLAYGIDFASPDSRSRQDISALTPNRTHAVWQESTKQPLVIPPSVLMSRKWYMDSSDVHDEGPGWLKYAVTGTSSASVTSLGEFWVTYTVKLAGTRP